LAVAARCNSVACNLCPTEAKFTALNSFGPRTEDPSVDIVVNARVRAVDIAVDANILPRAANPSLTAAALALRSAARMGGRIE
jgi:hypothetical protein